MAAADAQAAGKAFTLTSLPTDVQIEVFCRLPPNAVLPVCKTFQQLYHRNAHWATLVAGASVASTAAMQQCPTLVRLTAPPAITEWPLASLARLRRLDVAGG